MNPGAGRAPSTALPLSYLVTAAAAFVLAAFGAVLLAPELAGHYYHPRVMALTHVVTLGWITVVIVGASYQLVPIVLERRLWSERLARWQLPALVLGVIGVVAHFFIAQWPGFAWSAGLAAAALLAHVLNVGLGLRRLPRWTLTARLIAIGLAGLTLTALSGVLLGVNKAWPFLPGNAFDNLHAHVHVALLGWVAPMVLGVAARVYPMFLLAPEPSPGSAAVQFWGLAAGVPIVVAGLLLQSPVVLPGALAVAAAVGAHVTWVAGATRARKRPGLDWGLRFVVTAPAFAAGATVLGVAFAGGVLAGPRLALAYAVLAFGGWASLTIVGMLLKIVPFLVWYRVYGPRAGKSPVPTLAQLSSPRGEAASYVLLTTGLLALPLAVAAGDAAWIRAAGLLTALGALTFAATLGRVLRHLKDRSARPAPSARAPAAREATAR